MNIKLNLHGAKKAAAGLPWIYRKDLEHFRNLPPAGELARVQDAAGNFLAHAVSEGPRGVLAYRIVSRERHAELNQAWFSARVQEALARRRGLPVGEAQRLIHGEADGLPGVFCERHASSLLLWCESPGLEAHLPSVEEALWSLAAATALWRRDAGAWLLSRGKEGPRSFASRRGGLDFQVRLDEESPPDFSLAQSANWARLSALGLSGEALLLFPGRGAWHAAALAAGAKKTADLDSDPFARMDGLTAQKKTFEAVLADLPAEHTSSRLKFSAAKHAPALILRCMKLLVPGGLAAFALPQGLRQKELGARVLKEAQEEGIAIEVAAAGQAPQDFPVIQGFAEGDGWGWLAYRTKV